MFALSRNLFFRSALAAVLLLAVFSLQVPAAFAATLPAQTFDTLSEVRDYLREFHNGLYAAEVAEPTQATEQVLGHSVSAGDPSDYNYVVTRGTMQAAMPAPQGERTIDAHGFRFFCVPSHYSYDDPVVYPGESGRAHLHMFFGNTAVNADSTSESIVNSGASTCDGGITNRSAYWIPALYNEAGEVVLPKVINNYYKSWVSDRTQIRPIPQGLQILANDTILNSGGVAVSGRNTQQEIWGSPIRVTDHEGISVEINFPDCLAVDAAGNPILTSPGGTSHVAYSSGGCPASHPYNIPQLTQIVNWDNVPFNSNWQFASDESPATKGASVHADYIAGWTTESAQIMADCVRDAYRECGPPLHGEWEDTFFAPDGTQVYTYFNLASGVDPTPFGDWPKMLDTSGSSDHSDHDTDTDGDGHPDTHDNCSLVANISQLDTDTDGVGDDCDATPGVGTASPFAAGAAVLTTDTVNVRQAAGTQSALVGQQLAGMRGTVRTGNAVSTGGFIWLEVDFASGVDGWVATSFLEAAPSLAFVSGNRVSVMQTVNVREPAGLGGAVVGQQQAGALGTIRALAPVVRDTYTWVAVDFDAGVDGWVAIQFLATAPTEVTPTPVEPTPEPEPEPEVTPWSISLRGLTEGQTVSGRITVEAVLAGSPDVTNVLFAVDGKRVNREYTAPYYLGGDTRGTALGYDTTRLRDGSHTLTVTVRANGERQTLEYRFTVQNRGGVTPTEPEPEPVATETPKTPTSTESAPAPTSGTTLYTLSSLSPNGQAGSYLDLVHRSEWAVSAGTVSFSFMVDTTSGVQVLMRKGDPFVGTGSSFDLRVYEGSFVAYLRSATGGWSTVSRAIEANTWYTVQYEFGTNGATVSLNGTQIVDTGSSFNASLIENRENLRIGGSSWTDGSKTYYEVMDGQLKDLSITTR